MQPLGLGSLQYWRPTVETECLVTRYQDLAIDIHEVHLSSPRNLNKNAHL